MDNIVSQIQFYEQKLKNIPNEYNTSMLCEWAAIREKEVYFIRKLARLREELNNNKFKNPIIKKKQEDKIKQSDKKEKDINSEKPSISVGKNKIASKIDNKE